MTLNPSMKKKSELSALAGTMQPVTGRLTASPNNFDIMVECDGNLLKSARILSHLDRRLLVDKASIGRDVLLVFEGGDPEKPIIVGVMERALDDLVILESDREIDQKEMVDAVIDGRRVVLEAENEIVLKCGKGSITIQKDGKIVVKGTNLLSRSSGLNRIKGGSIGIN